MPYRRRRRGRNSAGKRRRRRNYRKRRGYRAKVGSLIKFRTTAFPDQAFVKLRFYMEEPMVNLSGFGYHVISMNNMNDPLPLVASTNQPLGYDQWSNFYQRNQVYASKISIGIKNGNTRLGTACLYPTTQTASIGSIEAAVTQPYSTRRYIANTNTTNSFRNMRKYMTIQKYWGMKLTGTNFQTQFNDDVNQELYWMLMFQNDDTTQDISNIVWTINVVYYARLFQRKNLTSS